MKRKGILALEGAHCASCVYTIEHAGRKIKGINDVRVLAGEHRVIVEYQGSESVLDKIADIVRRIGHDATVVETDAQ